MSRTKNSRPRPWDVRRGPWPIAAVSFVFATLVPAFVAPAQSADAPAGASGSLAGNALNTGLLPHDLSPWSMFLEADVVVKVVMISLAIASVVTWTVLLAKTMELTQAKHQARVSLSILSQQGKQRTASLP